MYSQLPFDYFRFLRSQTVLQALRSTFPKLSFRGVSIIRIFSTQMALKILLLLIQPYTQPSKESEKGTTTKILNQIQKMCTESPHWQIHTCPRKNSPGLLGCTGFFFFLFCHQKPCSCEDLPKAIRYYSLVLQFSFSLVLGFWYINVLSALLLSRMQIFVFPFSLSVIEHRTQSQPQLQSYSILIRHKASLQSTPAQICNAYFSQHQIEKAKSLKLVIMNHRNIKGFRRLKTYFYSMRVLYPETPSEMQSKE